ncbi:hypothetical protein [Spirillospora sp. NBC_01491]|uniref:hypothetical protein n=1 Tax=Spirillospora sp. NBC_01491 TaxID=2976007 RepID=UPI002E327FD7|nr:hypothetical protein [Spirillospora sp. NBC_01491]
MMGVVEAFLLHEGTVRLGAKAEPVELAAGDFIRYRADVPHVYEAIGRRGLSCRPT